MSAQTAQAAADLVADMIDRAQKAGADAADAVVAAGASLSAGFRLGKLEEVTRSEGRDMGLRVFIGRRSAVVSSTDWRTESRQTLVDRAVAMARSAPEDPFALMAPEDRLAKDIPDLTLDDPDDPSPDRLTELAERAEESALSAPEISNSNGGDASWGRSIMVLGTSTGFLGSFSRSRHSISVSVVAARNGAMETDYDYSSAVFAEDLLDPEPVGRSAAERAARRLGARKAATAKVPVVFDPRVGRTLLGAFANAISGRAVARGTSFLKDKMGTQIFAPGINVIDDPLRARGLGSRPFDGEGVAGGPLAVIDNGVLTTWLLDCSTAKQLDLETNGRAARGVGGNPSPSTTNLYLAPGSQTPEALIGEVAQGLYVTDLFGHGVNGVTGDFSQGAAGFWIENGQMAYPVSEITIAGNLKDMFRTLTPANDLIFRYGTNAPTLRIEAMTVAGS